MSRGNAGGPPVPDLSRMRSEVDAAAPGRQSPPIYVNDVAPSIHNDGTLTLNFAYQGAGGESPVTAVTMPVGLFLELAMLAPKLTKDGLERIDVYRAKLGAALEGGERRVAAAREQRGGEPRPIQ